MQKTYETYKDSGIEWIGNVPSHWEVFPMKYKVNLYNGNSIKDDEKPLYEDDSDAIPYIATKDVNVDNHSIDYENGMYVKNLDHSFVRAPKGSSLMCIEGGSAGRKIGITNQEVAFINKLCCFTTKDISILDNLYLYFYLQSSTFKNKFTSHLSGLIGGVSISEMKNFEMICPPLFEQQAIAEYLDKNCSKIDALIAELEQQVTDLGTMKKAEISRVVTKGLNPNAPLKDSRIEWIGEMPSHWSKAKLKRIVELKSGNTLSPDNIHNNGKYIVYGGNGARGFINTYTNDGHYVLIGRQGALCGNINYAHGKFWATEHAVICYPKENLETMWLGEMLRTMNLNQYSLSAAQPGLSVERIRELYIVIPPLDEQQAISKHLDTYCVKVDATVKELQYQIADLKLYKQSIISEAVTGKIKVID